MLFVYFVMLVYYYYVTQNKFTGNPGHSQIFNDIKNMKKRPISPQQLDKLSKFK